MNRITRIAAIALSLAAAGAAFADDITVDSTQHQSLKSRADVRAELVQFQAGKTDPWNQEYSLAAQFKSQLSRQQVLAELSKARDSGELAAMASEDSGSAFLAQNRRASTVLMAANGR